MTVSNDHGYAEPDSTVYVNTEAGPTRVGQYIVGTPEEALEFFSKKYRELSDRIDLELGRIAAAKGTPDAIEALIKNIQETLAKPNMVGDLKALADKIDALNAGLATRREEATAAKEAAKASALAKRAEIIKKAEELANSTQWKSTSESFKNLLDEWKAIASYERSAEQELWARFKKARSNFDRARKAHFANLDAARTSAKEAKDDLIAKAQQLATSTEWAATSTAFRDLMNSWKGLPRAARAEEDKLWSAFKAAQDAFFDARNSANAVRDGELGENLTAKLAVVAEAEALLPITDLDAAKSALRAIATKFEAIGHVPRADKDKLDRRMKAVEDAVRKLEEEKWRKSKPEVRDRANVLVTSFETALAKLDEQIAAATKAGNDAEIKKLTQSREQTAALLAAAQAGVADLG